MSSKLKLKKSMALFLMPSTCRGKGFPGAGANCTSCAGLGVPGKQEAVSQRSFLGLSDSQTAQPPGSWCCHKRSQLSFVGAGALPALLLTGSVGLAQGQAEVSMCVCPCVGACPRPGMGFAKCCVLEKQIPRCVSWL